MEGNNFIGFQSSFRSFKNVKIEELEVVQILVKPGRERRNQLKVDSQCWENARLSLQ